VEGLGEDSIRVVVVHNHYVLVAAAGSDWEAAGLIAEDLPSYFDGFHEYPVGLDSWWVGCRHDRWVIRVGRKIGGFCLCGLEALWLASFVALGGCN
jgi:hypothetical protein